MNGEKSIIPIGYMESDYQDKFGIPRQSGLTGSLGRIRRDQEYSSPERFRDL